jgi:Protein of unknown function (DUF664)
VSDPTIDAARDLLDDSLVELRASVDGCSAEELNRRPGDEQTNTLAVLATHAMHSTRAWLSLATAAPPPARDRPSEFTVAVDDPAEFLAWLDGVSQECRDLLAGEVAFEPGLTGTAPWRTGGAFVAPDEPVTAAWALLHALEHLREHVGHAQLTRDLVR